MKELGKGIRCLFLFPGLLLGCFLVSSELQLPSCLGLLVATIHHGTGIDASSLMCRYEIYIQGLNAHSSDTGNVPLALPLFLTLSQLSSYCKIPNQLASLQGISLAEIPQGWPPFTESMLPQGIRIPCHAKRSIGCPCLPLIFQLLISQDCFFFCLDRYITHYQAHCLS